MYGIDSEPPKNCMNCPLCQGEYGKGNEKSYCAINHKVKLKYRGSRPKECPIIIDPLPQWQIEFLTTLIEKAKESEIIKAYTKGFDTGVGTVKNERPKGEWIITGEEQGALGMIYKIKKCDKCGWEHSLVIPDNFCPRCGANMQKGGAE